MNIKTEKILIKPFTKQFVLLTHIKINKYGLLLYKNYRAR